MYTLNTSHIVFFVSSFFPCRKAFFQCFPSAFSFFFILITDEPKRRPLLWTPRSKRDTSRRGATFAIQSTTRKWRLRAEGLNERELRHVYSCERVWRVLEMVSIVTAWLFYSSSFYKSISQLEAKNCLCKVKALTEQWFVGPNISQTNGLTIERIVQIILFDVRDDISMYDIFCCVKDQKNYNINLVS